MIDMASTTGLMPDANMRAYAATKTAIHNITVALSPDLGTEGVTVNPIRRGLIASGTIQPMLQDMVKNQAWPAEPEQLERKAIAAWAPNPFGRRNGWRMDGSRDCLCLTHVGRIKIGECLRRKLQRCISEILTKI
jgi:NAD(P)-dependent dehydrogenase (short-subunit alcohol dehydrogenase family)